MLISFQKTFIDNELSHAMEVLSASSG